MKRLLLLSFIFLLLPFYGLLAKQVAPEEAQQAGRTFLATKVPGTKFKKEDQLQLVYTSGGTVMNRKDAATTESYFYIFNSSGGGFIIIAGDDVVTPVLGYSSEGSFDPENMPRSTAKWLEGYKKEIQYVLSHGLQATEAIAAEWAYLKGESTKGSLGKKGSSVDPLVKTKWNQLPYYNAMCPVDNATGQRTVSGCVATAMAQVMKYWSYPAKGTGFHSYNHNKYGTISANFGTATYNWSAMPNVVSGSNTAVATLMYHAGVSVDMNYGIASTGGSGAYVISSQSPVLHCTEYALKTYFGYSGSLKGVERDNYSQQQWLDMIFTELDASRPIIYAGFGGGGGHCFVADGYDENGYIHFNWGWGGASDGYFSINALNPGSLGTGGGSGGFNNGHQIVMGIKPPDGQVEHNLSLNSYVYTTASKIYYGQKFSVSFNVVNRGAQKFEGDYGAAIFDESMKFVDFVEVKEGMSLEPNYTYQNNLMFSTNGMLSMLPGKYYVSAFYRPNGGNWTAASEEDGYTNLGTIEVINPADIEMMMEMVVSPDLVLTQGKPAYVTLNVINDGSFTFRGQYSVNLFDLDGKFVETIGTVNENNGLPPGYYYKSPYLKFNSSSIEAKPGTYLLAVMYQQQGSTQWQLVGSSYFQNPIKVTVKADAMPPDFYEVNDKVGDAYKLGVSFSGNSASLGTPGATCHTGSDYDYYKIELPAGYNYTIKPRLHDASNSGNGQTYTLDALFSYSHDGGLKWSVAYDDEMSGDISLLDGGTLYFHVAPYFSGEMGSYLLDINITREPTVGIEEAPEDGRLALYPNPAVDQVTLEMKDLNGSLKKIELSGIDGKVIKTFSVNQTAQPVVLPLSDINAGIYFVNVHTTEGVLTRKLVISK